MQKVFKSCTALDKRCYIEYGLNEDILMEHAGHGMERYIRDNFKYGSTVLIVAGSGNNGADGIVLARQLYGDYDVRLYIPFGVKSDMAKLQLDRTKHIGLRECDTLEDADVVVDALFGAGFNRMLDKNTQFILYRLNSFKGFKIACDIPTGIAEDGTLMPIAFKADVTLTMGAYKEALYLDEGKDSIGQIVRVNLGVSSTLYEDESDTFVLEADDLKLPIRKMQTAHKGTFGHAAIFTGEKEGAGIIAGMAATRFGAGLTTLVVHERVVIPPYLMHTTTVPANTTAMAIGMGLGGGHFDDDFLEKYVIKSHLPVVLDADALHCRQLLRILEQKDRQVVITPHPREFSVLWHLVTGEELTVAQVQSDRFGVVRRFNERYPHVTLLLKGANTLIMQEEKLYINPLGCSKLSKGGSGDVLGGLIVSLLAQGLTGIDAAVQGSLALAHAAQSYTGSSYAMLATDLIEQIAKLEHC